MKTFRSRVWILPALGGAVVVNVLLFGLASLLAHERRPPNDLEGFGGVELVNLAPPEIPEEPEAKEPKPPKPEPKPDFTPDLVQPSFEPMGLDAGIAIDLSGLGDKGVGGDFVFEAYELDTPPQPIAKIPPVYPYKAREQGVEGAVQVKMLVNSDGSVGSIQILDARPKGYFEDAVLKTVSQWKFQPGKVEGEPVTAWVVTTLRFTLNG